MSRSSKKTHLEQILENLLFLADVFADKEDKDIPNVPLLELARCFELSARKNPRVPRRRSQRWSRWS